jgi:antirestriction protein ArdC
LRRSGLTPEPGTDHAAYIQSWLKVLKRRQAGDLCCRRPCAAAADYLHGLQGHVEDIEEAAA